MTGRKESGARSFISLAPSLLLIDCLLSAASSTEGHSPVSSQQAQALVVTLPACDQVLATPPLHVACPSPTHTFDQT